MASPTALRWFPPCTRALHSSMLRAAARKVAASRLQVEPRRLRSDTASGAPRRSSGGSGGNAGRRPWQPSQNGSGGSRRDASDDEDAHDASPEAAWRRVERVRAATTLDADARLPDGVDALRDEPSLYSSYDRGLRERGQAPPSLLADDPGRIAHAAPASPQAHVTTLASDPYGWPLTERALKEAPLWMLYAAEREEVALSGAVTTGARIRREPTAQIHQPMRDAAGRAFATGRRKTASANVYVMRVSRALVCCTGRSPLAIDCLAPRHF